ncbi:BTAD domain-containing putative transcriptional regulator [Spirillospora sp. NPDC048911]|uniref:BTAD domain-containing putative transcriptional regulator n=1 Tax=Spirillospora sp. NPDC048911 TaxID=3364527 RepID=UPI0037227DAF
MQFGILGPVEARRDGRPVPVGGPRVRALLALLALDAGRLVPSERLIDGLYGEEPPSGAANALQSQVSRLRRGLGAAELVEGRTTGYRLAIDPEDVDVHRFGRLVKEGRGALAGGNHAAAAELLREALGLWRGPALADLTAPFVAGQAARLEELRIAAIEDRAEAELGLGDYAVLPLLQELVAEHPLRELTHGLLMRALYGSGRQAEALSVYEDVRERLAEELGADPSAELAEVHLAILRGDVAQPPPAAVATLPAQLTTFVGREEELARVGKLLGEGRLVTLLGPGGTGKTRLAIEAGGRERGEVRFVDLSAVVNGSDLPQALLGALGVREHGLQATPLEQQPEPAERLVAAVSDRNLLLILDNCEQVIEDAARLTHRLLTASHGLRVLVTSREALAVTGEAILPLRPLDLPPAGAGLADALGSPALRLFGDRAAAVRPDFEITAANLDAVLQICTALDGLPLAIELAAARLRSLPVEEIAARLDDRFRLLSRGNRTAAPRHQTLRAVVEWSWGLLANDERELARRLTAFSGGFTLEAAARVCGPSLYEVDDLLAGLTDKSLVQSDGGRYRMLETVRAFCAERLAEAGEEEELRRAHAAYFLDLAERAEPELRAADQLDWMARLAAEGGNLRAALRWAVRAEPATAMNLIGALSWYWWLRGVRSELGPPAAELLGHYGTEPPEGLTEEYVLCVVHAGASGALGDGVAAYMRAAESVMDRVGIPAMPKRVSVLVLWAMSNPIPDRAEIDERRRHLMMNADPWLHALDGFSSGYQWIFGGEFEAARPAFDEALTRFRALGDRWGIANTLDGLAMIAELGGELERSLELLDEAFALVEQLGVLEDMVDLLRRRAEVFIRGGDLAAARAEYERAAEFAGRSGSPQKVRTARQGLGDVARLDGDHATARELYEEVLAGSGADWGWTAEIGARARLGLGWLAVTEGDLAAARAHFVATIDSEYEHVYAQTVAEAVAGMAAVALREGDAVRAATLIGGTRIIRESAETAHDIIRVTAEIRKHLDDDAFEAARGRGLAMTQQEALALARA